jgi:hypothetical protein
MTGKYQSKNLSKRKKKDRERVDLDDEDEDRRRRKHSHASSGISPDVPVSGSSLSSRSTNIPLAVRRVGGRGSSSLFSPPPTTVEIKREFSHKPSDGIQESHADNKQECDERTKNNGENQESDELIKKNVYEPSLDMSLDQASWVGRRQMVKEYVKDTLFGQMKFANKLRDEVFDLRINTVCGKLLQHCWRGKDITNPNILGAAETWWSTVGKKLTFETLTNTRNNVIKNIKCGYMGKFTNYWHCFVGRFC